MSGVARFSISVEPELLSEFDQVTGGVGMNRSSAVKAAMRGFLAEQKWSTAETGDVAGALTMVYDHHSHGIVDGLLDIQHNFTEVISSTTHVHLDHHNCLEIIAIRGRVARLRELKNRIEASKGIKQITFSLLNL
jgi:CopG family nickel-responsive transcriptional regulator